MKILILNFERTWRGGERQTVYHAEGFSKLGHEVVLLCRKGFPLERAARERSISVWSFSRITDVILCLMTRAASFDIFHVQTSHILTYCLLTRPFYRAKLVFSRRVAFTPMGRFTRWKYRLTDKIVAVSRAVKDCVEEFCGRTDIAVIPDIVELKDLDEERARSFFQRGSFSKRKYVIGSVAALTYEKDPFTLIEAIRILVKRRNDFLVLHFGAGDLLPAVSRQISEYGLEDTYFLPGFVRDVEDFYTLFDVFVLSSAQEGLGSSVLDSFLYKTPVVATNAGGLNELLAAGRGILCPTRDARCLAESLDHILNSAEDIREEMTAKAKAYVLDRHSPDQINRAYIEVFEASLKSV